MMRIPLAAVVAAVITGIVAASASAAVPQTTSPPTIQGTFEVGKTLTATNGGWANSPTSFAYQWQRCSSSGSGCANITGATAKTYKLAAADVDHTIRLLVTASNADGKSTANSHPSPVISDSSAPRNTQRPVLSGTAQVGETMTVSNGSWTGGVTSFTYQWQHCDVFGGNCISVAGATAKSYGVRSADVGMTLRVAVTAHNLAGATSVQTDRSQEVQDVSGVTQTVTTTQTKRPPTIKFVSLKVRGNIVSVRFRVCDQSFSHVKVVARDQMARRLAAAHRFAVNPAPCATSARSWRLLPRFRQHHHRLVVSLRATNTSGLLSTLVSRGVIIP
jgi:hypothetical protein